MYEWQRHPTDRIENHTTADLELTSMLKYKFKFLKFLKAYLLSGLFAPLISSDTLIVGRADNSGSMSPTTTVLDLLFAFLLLSSTCLAAFSSMWSKGKQACHVFTFMIFERRSKGTVLLLNKTHFVKIARAFPFSCPFYSLEASELHGYL